MQKDFHYYCIAVLAKAAGFNKKDSLIIAYASQYVDNSTESEPIKIGEMFFDPVRSAHNGLKAFHWDIQKKVYFPFHFIPPKSIKKPSDSFVTKRKSDFVIRVFKKAISENDDYLRLFRIGVALHTLADSWAHEGFSGREEGINNVENIHLFNKSKKKWKHLFFDNLILDLLPVIGHGQAGHYPDYSHLKWKYKRKKDNKTVVHDNTKEFYESAEKIYNLLNAVEKPYLEEKVEWKEISKKIKSLFNYKTTNLSKKCDKWKKEFDHWFLDEKYDYDRKDWRQDALGIDSDVNWDEDERSDFKKRHYEMQPGFYEKPWVKFHKAALLQRHYVIENLI